MTHGRIKCVSFSCNTIDRLWDLPVAYLIYPTKKCEAAAPPPYTFLVYFGSFALRSTKYFSNYFSIKGIAIVGKIWYYIVIRKTKNKRSV